MTVFSVTWDYLCPFARNAHEHLLDGLEDGAPWDVTFVPFSLMQSHAPDGGPAVWESPEGVKGLLALQAAVVVRDRFGERFAAVHRALFAARHDEGRDLGDPAVVGSVLSGCGLEPERVLGEVAQGWPLAEVRRSHEESVSDHQVFGVPTFMAGGQAVFVRIMTRPGGDGTLARSTVERVLDMVTGHPEINELKHTSIPR